MKRLFSLLLVSAFMFSFAAVKKPDGTKLEPRRTVIAGVVENYTDDAKVIFVDFFDYLNERDYVQDLTKSDGRFFAEHDCLFDQDRTIRLGDNWVHLFVNAGDSVFVHIDAAKLNTDFENAVRFSGSNPERNKEFARWANYSKKIYRNFHLNYDCAPEEVIGNIEQIFAAAKDSISAYAQRTGSSDFIQKWTFDQFRYLQANYLLDYESDKTEKWALYTDPVFDVFNEDHFQTMYFPYHLNNCGYAFIWNDVEINNLIDEQDYTPAIRLTIEKMCEKLPEGTVRDVILYLRLKSAMEKMPELYDSLPEIKTAFSHGYFADKLEEIVENHRSAREIKLSEEERALYGVLYLNGEKIEKLPEGRLLNYLAEKYKDKVLYIDVWATSCGHCFEYQEQFAPDLHKHFEGEDVIFVNLCLESNVESWLPTIKKHNIVGENYFFDTNSSRSFRADNKISGFPTYLMIDKNGILYNPAPHLSDLPELIKKIESLLK